MDRNKFYDKIECNYIHQEMFKAVSLTCWKLTVNILILTICKVTYIVIFYPFAINLIWLANEYKTFNSAAKISLFVSIPLIYLILQFFYRIHILKTSILIFVINAAVILPTINYCCVHLWLKSKTCKNRKNVTATIYGNSTCFTQNFV